MSTRDGLDPEFTRSVISHMNEDHADACLCMVKAFSDETRALSARLCNLDRNSLYFSVQTPAPATAATAATAEQSSIAANANADVDVDADSNVEVEVEVIIDFPAPLRTEKQVRGALVGMTGQARKRLADDSQTESAP